MTQTHTHIMTQMHIHMHRHIHTHTETNARALSLSSFFQRYSMAKLSVSFTKLTFQDKLLSDLHSQSETIWLRVDFRGRSLGSYLAMGRIDSHGVLETMGVIPASQPLDT